MTDGVDSVSDVVGIGFGPANLALAIALNEDVSPTRRLELSFLEKQPRFGWHGGMLLDGATMQVAFLKDLVTLRNPCSPFTFVSYLHSVNRLSAFINSKAIYPLRREFHDYLEWCASEFTDTVRYGADVTGVRPVVSQGKVSFVDVDVRTEKDCHTYRAANVVIGAGLHPWMPPDVVASDRVWHSDDLVAKLADLDPAQPLDVVVVGSGQSAAEVVAHIHGVFQNSSVTSVYSRFGYGVADDSPFVNEFFDPDAVSLFYDAPEDVKEMLLGYHRNANYSVVDLDLSTSLYQRLYEEMVKGRRRLRMLNVCRVDGLTEASGKVNVDIEHLPTGRKMAIDADVVVFATGYRPVDPEPLLGELVRECKRDSSGNLVIDRDYRVVTSDSVRCGIYVHGSYTERLHGLSAGLLSNVAVRAGEIAQAICKSAISGDRGV
ncbi:lysine N(6)-hydroxylase/L-ornithine N(5)-oxygenase family protein [Nocardia brasiliensis]|uniref:lysine N(6)-hydroxylase/L-ornithine N(5)-oxygenase family protein n=1 Tax=Nocardia brasiliensis TaxID=37326 RepID=UPI002457F37D|nr:SidA/IucD/PvdA family monooxygenase [Nocardia brasiliensis]